jgi:hypothetical protein
VKEPIFIAICFCAVLAGLGMTAHAGGISSDLLLSSPWCSFSYNKTTGYSNTTRVRFFRNGTYSTGGRAEGSSSNKYGSYASQHDSGSAGKWKVSAGVLYISAGNGQLNPVKAVVTRNSNGYPVITADGTEYTRCK